MPNKPTNETYLGDGLYCLDSGYDFQLWCDRENGKNWVALEPQVLSAFLEFIERQRGVKFKITKREESGEE